MRVVLGILEHRIIIHYLFWCANSPTFGLLPQHLITSVRSPENFVSREWHDQSCGKHSLARLQPGWTLVYQHGKHSSFMGLHTNTQTSIHHQHRQYRQQGKKNSSHYLAKSHRSWLSANTTGDECFPEVLLLEGGPSKRERWSTGSPSPAPLSYSPGTGTLCSLRSSPLSSLLCSLYCKARGMAAVKKVCWERFRRRLINVSICILTTKHVVTWNQIQFCHNRFLSFLYLRSGSLRHLMKVKRPSPKFLQILEKCIAPCSICLQVSSVPWVLFLLETLKFFIEFHTQNPLIQKNTYERNKVSTGPLLHRFHSAAHGTWLLTQNFENSRGMLSLAVHILKLEWYRD